MPTSCDEFQEKKWAQATGAQICALKDKIMHVLFLDISPWQDKEETV